MAVRASGVTVQRDPTGPDRPGRHRRARTLALCLLTLLSLLPLGLLAAAAWFGRHVRPSADEWCFLPVVRDHGIAGLVGKFYVTDNGRIGNGLLVGLYAQFPVAGHQWFGLVSVVLTLGVLWALAALLVRGSGRAVPPGVPLLVAAMVTAVFLLATPNTYKTFYWPAASVSHTLAPVLACAAVLPALCARGRRGRIAALAVVLVAGVFLGTLSEETSVVALVVLAGLLLLGHRLFAERVRVHVRRWTLVAMAGVAIGTVLLVTSPGSRRRRERFGAEAASMTSPDTLTAAARGYLTILETVFTTWQYAGAVAAGVLLGVLVRRRPEAPPVLRPGGPALGTSLGALTFLVSGYLCTVVTYPVFGPRVVSAARTWNDYLLLYVLVLVAAGVLLGRALRTRAPRPWTGWAAAAAVAVYAGTAVGLAGPLHQLGQDMRVRAERWDRQDAWLRARAAEGAGVLPYTPLSVGGMVEPFRREGRDAWPAQCVATYYRLERVTYSTRLP
ncbi:DUF6056 family protein [Streptomyces sp. FIT100]|uniref:DUF6056 family protein n=1 Tax=Streptomyces sp. FIT100 TaxID=2837956 RepID=UPI0021C91190|nr:DUF6056 family protein [Streptomyces sp. FIT100]UUN25096.1 hypothetical protein KK483_00655 [Streptomyces sp. FIT100]